MNKTIQLLLIFLLINSCQTKTSKENTRLAIFDEVWSHVDEHLYDQNFNGVDWDKKYKEYQIKIENCTSDDSLFVHLNQMLFDLNSSHCGIGLLSELDNAVSPYLFKTGEVGLDVRLIENKIVVTRVLKNSSANSNWILDYTN